MTPDELLIESSGQAHLVRNDVPDNALARDRERCRDLLLDVLGEDLQPDGLRCSPLGARWTDVFDAHVRRQVDPSRLLQRGWLPVHVSAPGRLWGRAGEVPGTWAVVEDDRVLAGLRLRSDDPAEPAQRVIDRCREQGEVRLRDVLELRLIRRTGGVLPTSSPVLRAAAEIESGLEGRDLAPWATGRSVPPPARIRPRLRPAPRRFVVAISGVDGSGKSTLRAALHDALHRVGLPVTVVWIRPGMGLGALASVAVQLKRALGQDVSPGIRSVAAGEGRQLRSRRGTVGWLWALTVTLMFLSGVWRQQLTATGVVLHDRHLVDALATLDFGYEGVDLRVHRWLLRTCMPRATVQLYLDVPAEVAVSRKPDDVIGSAAVRRQLQAYEHWLGRSPGTERLDATLPPSDLALQAVAVVLGASRSHRTHTRKSGGRGGRRHGRGADV